MSQLLILPDGRVLAHNLTPVLAGMLKRLGLCGDELAGRVAADGCTLAGDSVPGTIESMPI